MKFNYKKYIFKKISLYIILVILIFTLGTCISLLSFSSAAGIYENHTLNEKYNYPIFGVPNYDNLIKNYIDKNSINSTKIDYKINIINDYLNILFIKEENKKKIYDSLLFNPDKQSINLIEYLNIDRNSYNYHIKNALEARNIIFTNDISKHKVSFIINKNTINLYIDDIYMIEIATNVFKEKLVPVTTKPAINYKYVAFTFDDGPSKYTSEIMDILDKYNYKATFFQVGYMMKSKPELVKEVINRGYEIGNHTTDHPNLNKLSRENIIARIENNSNLLKEYTNKSMNLVRCPYGNSNSKVKEAVNYPIIYWSIDSRDWESRNADKIYNTVIKDIQDGDIVLFHDLYEPTKQAVERLTLYLYENNYKVVSVSELFKIKGKKLENHKVYKNAR